MADDNPDILAPPQKRSLADDVVERLRRAIWNGRLAPDERLREEGLAELLGVSRGPIREALIQLEREGLVIRQPNRGAVVARLSREDLDEVYTLRLAIERLAVQQAVRHAEERHFAQMQEVVNNMAARSDQFSEQMAATLDVRFHEILFQSAQHKRLYDTWATLKPQIHIFLLSRNVANPDFRAMSVEAHQAILDAIRERDEARAVAQIETHLRESYERILQHYPEPGTTVAARSESAAAGRSATDPAQRKEG